MKILSVVASALQDDATGRRISNIARLLRSMGHEVTIVQYVRKSTWATLGGSNLDCGDVRREVVFVSAPTAHLRHLRELCKVGYDLVYGNRHDGTFLSLLGKAKKVRLIFDMHGGLIEELQLTSTLGPVSKGFASAMNRFIDSMDIHFADKIFCVSKKMMRLLEQKGVPSEKMAYVTNGVDLEFFKPVANENVRRIREKLGIRDKLVFGYIGGMQKWQGVENLIESARKTANEEIAFLIVGTKKEKIERERNVVYIPRVDHGEVPLYCSACDILVLPRPTHLATEIAAPTKFSEYAAMGKPLLVTMVGDAADLVIKYNCGIVTRNNLVGSLTEGIEEFSLRSEKELSDMGRLARKMAEDEFNWNEIRDEMHKAIESITHAHS